MNEPVIILLSMTVSAYAQAEFPIATQQTWMECQLNPTEVVQTTWNLLMWQILQDAVDKNRIGTQSTTEKPGIISFHLYAFRRSKDTVDRYDTLPPQSKNKNSIPLPWQQESFIGFR